MAALLKRAWRSTDMSTKAGNASDATKRKKDGRLEKSKMNEDIGDFHLVCKAFTKNDGRRDAKDDVISDLAAMGCTCVDDPVISDTTKIFSGFMASEAFVSRSLKTQTPTSARNRLLDKPETITGMSELFPEIEEATPIAQLPPLPSPSIPFSRSGHSEPHLQVKASAYAFGTSGPRSASLALPWLGTEGLGAWKGETSGDPHAPLIGGALWSKHIVNERDTPIGYNNRGQLGAYSQTEVEWDGRWIHEGAEAEGIIVYEELTSTYKKISRSMK